MRQLLRRLRYLLRQRQMEKDLAEEMDLHRELKEQDLTIGGTKPQVAAMVARRSFGNATLARENARAVWIWPSCEAFIRDIRFGIRLLFKNPGFSVIAILTLAVTIGANTAVFTLVDRTLIRPLPYLEPDRLATVARVYQASNGNETSYSQSGQTFLSIRDNVPALQVAALGGTGGVNLVTSEQTAYIQQQRVSAGYFSVLGVQPLIGREFNADDDQVGGPTVAILGHSLWTRMFAADAGVLGRDITLRGERFTVIGVLPPSFRSVTPADIWTPLRPSTRGEGGGANYLLTARVNPGFTWGDADGQVGAAGAMLIKDGLLKVPTDIQLTLRLKPLQQLLASDVETPLLILWAAVGIVLLIGCVNIAGLMLVRSAARAQEIATRIALGGGRATIIRQLLAESFVLAGCGAIVGVALGYVLAEAISLRLETVIGLSTTPDVRIVIVAVAISFFTSLVFGLFPAIQASRTDVRRMLVDSGGSTIAGPARQWSARLLVVAEVALGIVLVVAAGLLIRTFSHLTDLRPGFDSTNVITGTLSLQDARYQTAERVHDLFSRSLERIKAAPGVERAAVALSLPFERALNQGWRFRGEANSQPEPISMTYVTPEYFETLRIPLRSGRTFLEHDTLAATRVVVVNESFARRYAPGADPIGRRIAFSATAPGLEIVGVVGDTLQRANFGNYGPVAAVPAAYVPATQYGDGDFRLAHTWFEPSWIVRTALPPGTIVPVMQQALRDVDPQLPFQRFRTLDDVQGEALLLARIQATLLGTLAAIGLLLCALGVYGLVASSVTERRREFGVRLALGATPAMILRSATAPGIVLATSGVFVGLVLAAAVATTMRRLIFGVPVHDPLTFVAATGVVMLTACMAAFVPAVRTLRTNVIGVMRGQ